MSDETMHTWRDWVRGCLKSWTVRFSALLLVLPDVLRIVQDQFAAIAPYIPDGLESRVLNLVGLIVWLLRIRTAAALPHR